MVEAGDGKFKFRKDFDEEEVEEGIGEGSKLDRAEEEVVELDDGVFTSCRADEGCEGRGDGRGEFVTEVGGREDFVLPRLSKIVVARIPRLPRGTVGPDEVL